MKKTMIFKCLVVAALMLTAIFAVMALSSCEHTHSYTSMSVMQVPTCSEIGVQRAECSCGDFQVREIPKTAHTAGEWVDNRPATCYTKGTKQLHCKVCDEVMQTEVVPALSHDLVQYERKEPTCSEIGYQAYEACTRCSYSTYKEIATLPHTPGAEPTCTEPQLCSVCEGVVNPPKGHVEVVTTGSEATCSKAGLTDRVICISCDSVLQEAVEIPKRAHTTIELPAVAATCTATGRTRGVQCTACGDYVITPAWTSKLPHSYSSNVCTVCGEKKVCRHNNTVVLVKSDPTCTKYGISKGSACEDCGEILTAQTAIEILNHTIVTVPSVAATPTRPGLTEGSYCSVCRTILKQQDIIPALSRIAP